MRIEEEVRDSIYAVRLGTQDLDVAYDLVDKIISTSDRLPTGPNEKMYWKLERYPGWGILVRVDVERTLPPEVLDEL